VALSVQVRSMRTWLKGTGLQHARRSRRSERVAVRFVRVGEGPTALIGANPDQYVVPFCSPVLL